MTGLPLAAALLDSFALIAQATRGTRQQGKGNLDALRVYGHSVAIIWYPNGKLCPPDRFEVELAPTKGWEFDDGLEMPTIWSVKWDW